MGYDFTLYEQKTEDIGNKRKIILEEVMYLSNSCAMIVAYWIHRNIEPLFKAYDDLNLHFIELYSGNLKEMDNQLIKVLGENDKEKRDLLALHYFPTQNTMDKWISSVEMWSDSYYGDLEIIHEKLNKLTILDGDFDGMLYDYNYMFQFQR